MGSPVTPLQPGQASPAGQDADAEEQSIHQQSNAKLGWPKPIWDSISRVLHDESMRVQIGHKVLRSSKVHPKTTTIRPDTILNQPLSPQDTGNTLTSDEGQTIRLYEIWTEIALTPQQVHETAQATNPEHTTMVTLARRAMQYLSLAKDMAIFQGSNAFMTPFFNQNIGFRTGQTPADPGLLGTGLASGTVISIPPLPPGQPGVFGVTYGQNIFTGVVQGYSALTALGHPGDYALILDTQVYADLYAPVGNGSLVVTADRVAPLVKAGLHGTGTIASNILSGTPPVLSPPIGSPPSAGPLYGLLIDPVGDTMDLVVGVPPTISFMQQDANDNYILRVLERFTHRIKDSSAIVVLQFESF